MHLHFHSTDIKWFYSIFCMLVIVLQSGCTDNPEIVHPTFDNDTIIQQSTPLQSPFMSATEGVYDIVGSSVNWGSKAVLHWTNGVLCIYFENSGTYAVLKGGIVQNTFAFSGFWRNPLTINTGKVQCIIQDTSSIMSIIRSGNISDLANIPFTLNILSTAGENRQTLTLRYIRPSKFRNENYFIIAHRGGGRNSDLLPFSENSINLIRFSEYIGANAVEIDIKLTSDGIPILYHDTDFNSRLIGNGTLIGPVESFSFTQIRTFAKLHDGSDIPTLREALQFIIDSTTLRFVWLDIKSVNAMRAIIPLQKEFTQKAKEKNKSLFIATGLASEEFIQDFMTLPQFSTIPSIVETSVDDMRKVNARVFAPRWTLGTQNELIQTVKQEGRFALVWTLDDQKFIRKFLAEGQFNGILTNFPSIVAYEYYVQ